jgi:hypothetical protein
VPFRKKKDAARWPALLARDSDGDGYSNGVELTFGSMPGRRDSRPSRPAAQLERWRTIIVRELRGKSIAELELDPRIEGARQAQLNLVTRDVASEPHTTMWKTTLRTNLEFGV